MSDGPNRWEVAAPLPLYSWGRQWNVRADPIERTPHDPMRSTSTAPIEVVSHILAAASFANQASDSFLIHAWASSSVAKPSMCKTGA